MINIKIGRIEKSNGNKFIRSKIGENWTSELLFKLAFHVAYV